ncbi:unnamed protein product, partial [Mesorhabditis belari]|uniref:Uncharacterized protein n=1 Tax=Mesorhabditis belari TaxID=2138241 RepID=A0AAF3FQX0_9BILA
MKIAIGILISLTLISSTIASRKCWADSNTNEHHTKGKREVTCDCGDYCVKWQYMGVYTWGCSCSSGVSGDLCPSTEKATPVGTFYCCKGNKCNGSTSAFNVMIIAFLSSISLYFLCY